MKKKIKELTLEEMEKLCSDREHYCIGCPLQYYALCFTYVYSVFSNSTNKNKFLNKEVEVDE